MLDHFSEVLKLFRLPRAALLADLDGTLSEMVMRPEDAVVPPETRNALARLHQRLALVAVITGRSAKDALGMVKLPQLTYVGNHGLECIEGGEYRVKKALQPYLSDMRAAAGDLNAALTIPGVWLEDKGLSLAIHYRHAPNRQEADQLIHRALCSLPNQDRFRVIGGKEVVNVLPALGTSKGSAVVELAEEHRLSGALFMGDDVGDLDAFDAIRTLRSGSRFHGLNVAVLGAGSSSLVEKQADFTLANVEEASCFLTRLAESLA